MPWLMFSPATPSSASSRATERSDEQRPKAVGEPIWSLDLRSLGYQQPLRRNHEAHDFVRAEPLWFLRDSVLVFTYITSEVIPALQHRDDPNRVLPFKLHAIFLDSLTGKVLRTHDWYVESQSAGIVSRDDGTFLLFTASRLSLYSSDLELLKELLLPLRSEVGDLSRMFSSPNGRSVLLDYNNRKEHTYKWINTDNMQLVDLTLNRFLVATSISSQEMVNSWAGSPPLVDVLEIRKPDGPWRTICRAAFGCGGIPRFTDSNELLALTGRSEFKIIRTDGKEMFRQEFPYGIEGVGTFPPASQLSGGGRFAVTIFTQKGGAPSLDIWGRSVPLRVMVLDTSNFRWDYVLDCKKHRIRQISGLALSRGGSLLALTTNGIVQLYSLPTSPSAEQAPLRYQFGDSFRPGAVLDTTAKALGGCRSSEAAGPVPVYPPCTSLGLIGCFWRFSRLIESITYASSASLLVRSPPPLP